MLLDLFIGY
jgi:hypothetical protein